MAGFREIVSAMSLAALSGAAAAHEASPGRPAKPLGAVHATRSIEITANDADGHMIFSPDRIDVVRGEAVRFAIHNAGALAHEFVIGTRAENAAHARMMAAMPDMKHDEPNAVTIPAGASTTLVWRFSKSGEFEFACLIPGHYESGMHGAVNVK